MLKILLIITSVLTGCTGHRTPMGTYGAGSYSQGVGATYGYQPQLPDTDVFFVYGGGQRPMQTFMRSGSMIFPLNTNGYQSPRLQPFR
jgi:hypothetical protein